MAEFYRGTRKTHCVFYQKMQRSVRESFICTGGGFWDACPDYMICRLLEVRNGTPEPYDPDKPQTKKKRARLRVGAARPFARAAA